jgi:hypothetical protein
MIIELSWTNGQTWWFKVENGQGEVYDTKITDNVRDCFCSCRNECFRKKHDKSDECKHIEACRSHVTETLAKLMKVEK